MTRSTFSIGPSYVGDDAALRSGLLKMADFERRPKRCRATPRHDRRSWAPFSLPVIRDIPHDSWSGRYHALIRLNPVARFGFPRGRDSLVVFFFFFFFSGERDRRHVIKPNATRDAPCSYRQAAASSPSPVPRPGTHMPQKKNKGLGRHLQLPPQRG